MKTKQISLLLITLAFGVTCFARAQRWPIPARPAITMGQAEVIGDKAINQKHPGFFCIGADFALLGESDLEWELRYTNAKGEHMLVLIDTKGNAQILNNWERNL